MQPPPHRQTPFAGLDGLAVALAIPDLWQQEAVRGLRDGRDVIVDAPTGAGKTRIFELAVDGGHIRGQAVYTVPTRALANDKFAEWRRAGWDVGIATGDVAENVDAPVLVATLETQRERLIRGERETPGLLVVDEYQLIGDAARGLSYEIALALAPRSTRLLLLSGSVANPGAIGKWLGRLGRDVAIVRESRRPVPLEEIPVEALPYSAPKSIKGFWPRTAAEVLMADMGPLLLFAPQRAAAAKIAGQIAAALPVPHPLVLTAAQQSACGRNLSRLLERRVAFHHSGLPFAARAGVIEPLAKAGQLRVIVATTGLAAGINFSVRSALVTDARFTGPDGAPRELASDELLQMFGRAGRRGLDEIGYAILTRNGPSLSEAAPKHLRRSNEIDWPPLLRAMAAAASKQTSPFDAARTLCDSLFSEQRISLGFSAPPPAADGQVAASDNRLFNIGPTKVEIFNSEGHWEDKRASHEREIPLELGTIFFKNYLEPALAVFQFVANSFPVGRVCKIPLEGSGGGHYFGKEVAVAVRDDAGQFVLTKNVRGLLKISRKKAFSLDQIEDKVLPRLATYFHGGSIVDITIRSGILVVRLDFSRTLFPAYEDSHGVYLIDAEERTVAVEVVPTIVPEGAPPTPEGSGHLAAANSPAAAWRKLGLIEADGTPTPRGRIFSYFQGGEGLAIAAALEMPSYAIDDLLADLANLRAGRRFQDFEAETSDRIAVACRGLFGAVTYEGYLEDGLPTGYGEGAAEAVAEALARRSTLSRLARDQIGAGDIERAVVEWFSLLRHIAHAPADDAPRWGELRAAATGLLVRHAAVAPTPDLPRIPAAQLGDPPRHKIYFNQF